MLHFIGIMIHYIDDIWRLHQQVFDVEELGASHQGAILVEVVHRVQEEFDTHIKDKQLFTFLFY